MVGRYPTVLMFALPNDGNSSHGAGWADTDSHGSATILQSSFPAWAGAAATAASYFYCEFTEYSLN